MGTLVGSAHAFDTLLEYLIYDSSDPRHWRRNAAVRNLASRARLIPGIVSAGTIGLDVRDGVQQNRAQGESVENILSDAMADVLVSGVGVGAAYGGSVAGTAAVPVLVKLHASIKAGVKRSDHSMTVEKDTLTAESVKLYVINSHHIVIEKDITLFLSIPIFGVVFDLGIAVSDRGNFHIFSLLSLVCWIMFIIWGVRVYSKVENKKKLSNCTISLLVGNSFGVLSIAAISVCVNSLVVHGDTIVMSVGLLSIVVATVILLKLGIWAVERPIFILQRGITHTKKKKKKLIPAFLAKSMVTTGCILGVISGRVIMSNIPVEIARSPLFIFGFGVILFLPCIFLAVGSYYRVYLIRKFKLSRMYIH